MADLTQVAGQVQAYVAAGEMLIAIGKATVEEVKGFFHDKFGDDDAVLDAAISDLDTRIAAREAAGSEGSAG